MNIRRLLVAEPGADYCIQDVYTGLSRGLRECGVEVEPFYLNVRLDRAASWLNFAYEEARKVNPDIAQPTNADLVYQAGKELVLQALRGNQDGVLIVSGMFFHPDLLIMLRRAGIPTAMVLTESPYQDASQARVIPYVDLAWTNDRASLPVLRAANPNVGYLPAGYDPQVHTPDPTADEDVPAHDVVFVGTAFPERVELLEAVNWDGIDFGLYGVWDMRPDNSPLDRYLRSEEPIPNATTAALYRAARIGLNLYRTSEHSNPGAARVTNASALNPRAYELAATGTFQISDWRPEVSEVFGDSVPTFSTAYELEQLVRYFLAYPEERHALAARAHRAIEAHTWAARARVVIRDLATVWGQRRPELVMA